MKRVSHTPAEHAPGSKKRALALEDTITGDALASKERKKRVQVTLDIAYAVFAKFFPTLMSLDQTARDFWDKQAGTKPSRRYLQYQDPSTGVWLPTGSYSDCKVRSQPRKVCGIVTLELAHATFAKQWPTLMPLDDVARDYWQKQAPAQPRSRHLLYRDVDTGVWLRTGSYNTATARGRPPSNRGTVTLELAHATFLKIWPTVMPLDQIARDYWEKQLTKPCYRHLLFQNTSGKWLPTGNFNSAQSGDSRNLPPEVISEIHRKVANLVPPEERQQHCKEARAIAALIKELDQHARIHGLSQLRWKFVPDCIAPDVLLQRADTTEPEMWWALQVKSATWDPKNVMTFHNTDHYQMPVVCLAMQHDTIMELLVFPWTLERTSVNIMHGKISRDPEVQGAKIDVDAFYTFLLTYPEDERQTRNEWVYGTSAFTSYLIKIGLEVQQFAEQLLGHEVESPLQQNSAVDAFMSVDDRKVGVSFKTATPIPSGFVFDLGKATNRNDVQLFVVGFRDERGVSSLGVLPASAVDYQKQSYHWSHRTPFAGTANIITGAELMTAMRKYLE